MKFHSKFCYFRVKCIYFLLQVTRINNVLVVDNILLPIDLLCLLLFLVLLLLRLDIIINVDGTCIRTHFDTINYLWNISTFC